MRPFLKIGGALFLILVTYSSNERVLFAESEALIAAYDPQLPPLHIDGSELDGFSIDIMKAISERQELDVEFVPMREREAVRSLKEGDVDLILSVTFTDDLANEVEFSDSILSTSIGIVAPSAYEEVTNATDLSGNRIALQMDTLEYEFLSNIRDVHYHVASNPLTAMEILMRDRADVFIGNVLTASYYLEHTGQSEYEMVDSYFLPADYSIVVAKDNYALLHEINSGLRELKRDNTYSTIHDDWFLDIDTKLTDQLWLVIQIIGALFLIVIAIVFLGIRWNRQLKSEVDKQTSALKELNLSLQSQIKQTKNSTEFQRQILSSSPRGIITIRDDGLITSSNPKAAAILRLTHELVGTFYRENPLLKEWLEDKHSSILGSGQTYLGIETTWRPSDGSTLYFRYYVYPLYDFTKSITGLIFAIEDITTEKTLRTQMYEQEKSQALSRLVASIAHETRNPLSAIKTFVEMLPKKMSNRRFQEQIVTYVPKEIDRIDQLMKGLIDYSNPKKQKQTVVDVATLLEESTALFERSAQGAGVQLVKLWKSDLCVFADPSQLKQVLINLIINGIDAMNSLNEGNLTVEARKNTDRVTIAIIDEGMGFTEEQRMRAYEPFFTTKENGTGLGLAISFQYVHENKGTITIYSRKNKGSRIEITFPAVSCEKGENQK
ncbi:transporter substrate-binding domain-containing protein [Shouchella shacheensis]|uniref:transporter substrate-binding domain-containing protein n=1 Tax=Shouchella shacheensis TaxID=1649580 RepID=UPI00073FEA04|nr:transporter substrate-binding domain-containing protein [Shouchella shacheensis]